MKTNQQSASGIARIGTLMFVVLVLLACSQEALAQWTNGTNINNTNSGNVGIGTSAPGYKLEVQSPARHTIGVIGDGDSVGYAGISIGALTTTNIATNRTSRFNLVMRKDSWFGGDGSGPSFIIESTSKVGGFAAPFMITPTNNVILNGGQGASGLTYGNVGIGTTAPVGKLNIVDGLHLNIYTSSGASGSFIRDGLTVVANPDTGYSSMVIKSAHSLVADRGLFRIFRNDGISPQQEIMYARMDGQIGIGTIVPGYKLDVQGGQINASGGLCIAGDCKTSWSQVGGSSQWTTSGSNIFYSGGNVGIGTGSPGGPLDVRDSSGRQLLWNMASAGHTFVNANGGNVHIAGNLYFNGTNWNRVNTAAAGGMWWAGNDGTLAVLQTPAGTNPVSAFNWNFFIGTNGNVGIGTATPTAKLHVAGDGRITGNLTVDGTVNAKYQDVAEWVPSAHAMSAGTVVVLNPNQSNQVIASAQAYDTRVAGVISETPGLTLGEGGEGKVLVATTGRVRVRVDATRRAIAIGDLLVTSDIPGVAMKSIPVEIGGVQIHRPGTLIGKALESLGKGQGEILVLLGLQ